MNLLSFWSCLPLSSLLSFDCTQFHRAHPEQNFTKKIWVLLLDSSALASARSKGKQEKLPAAQAKADQAAAVFDSAKTALSEVCVCLQNHHFIH